MRKFISAGYLGLVLVCFISCSPTPEESETWCDRPYRKGFENYEELATSHPWFKVYPLGDSVYAPYNRQEVISYLIIGSILVWVWIHVFPGPTIETLVQGGT